MDGLESLGSFIAELRWEDLPKEQREKTRSRILHGLAAALVARDSPTSRKVLAMNETAADAGTASFWLSGRRGSIEDVTFANTIMASSILLDDGGLGCHPAATVVPAALAVAESEGRSGEELLVAVMLGYEIQARLVADEFTHIVAERGFRGTAVQGCFGAVSAAARLMQLGPDGSSRALALAASLCSPGIEQPIIDGTDERSIQTSFNSRSGVFAASLARQQFAPTPQALSGDLGFFAVYRGEVGDVADLVSGLGSTWAADAFISYPYPTGGWNIGAVYSALELVQDGPLTDLDAIERIEVLHPWWRRNKGYLDVGPFTTIEQALVSCPFGVAIALIFGDFDWELVKQGFGDPKVDALAPKVHMHGVATYEFTGGSVELIMKDGSRRLATSENIPSHLVQPTWDEVVDEFHRLVAFLPSGRRDAIVQAVGDLDTSSSVDTLASLLREPVEG